jgi:hypothetical protein
VAGSATAKLAPLAAGVQAPAMKLALRCKAVRCRVRAVVFMVKMAKGAGAVCASSYQ